MPANPHKMAKEDQGLLVLESGEFFCKTCNFDAVKNFQRNALKKHFKLKKHAKGMFKLREASEVKKMLTANYSATNREFGNISLDTLVARRRLVRAVVAAGIALEAILSEISRTI